MRRVEARKQAGLRILCAANRDGDVSRGRDRTETDETELLVEDYNTIDAREASDESDRIVEPLLRKSDGTLPRFSFFVAVRPGNG